MESEAKVRNRTFATLRQEVVLRDDGRYLIYYSLPDSRPADATRTADGHKQPPDQQPWSPDREPDV